jgi:uncharacterized protein YbjT (DUF2867 family)
VILLAGGTGHLGSALVEQLTSHGLQVRLLTRDPSRARRLSARDVELVAGDVRQAASLESALAGADTVISAVTGFGPGGAGPRAVDLKGNENLISAAEAAGAKRFILVSIHGARPDHPMELYRMKFFAEERLRRSALDWTIIRPTAFMELWAGIVGRPVIEKGKTTVFGSGNNPINFVSVEDVARFVVLAVMDARLRRESLDVGGQENLALNDLVDIFEQIRGRKAAVRHIPLLVMRLGAFLMRPLRPDLASLIQAGVMMDTVDMRFDPDETGARYPEIQLTHLANVVRRQYGAVTASVESAPPAPT